MWWCSHIADSSNSMAATWMVVWYLSQRKMCLLQTRQQNIFHLFSSFSFRMRKKESHKQKKKFLEIRLWVKLQLSYVIIKMQLVRIQEFCFWVLLVKLKVGRLRWLGKRLEVDKETGPVKKMSFTYARISPQKRKTIQTKINYKDTSIYLPDLRFTVINCTKLPVYLRSDG